MQLARLTAAIVALTVASPVFAADNPTPNGGQKVGPLATTSTDTGAAASTPAAKPAEGLSIFFPSGSALVPPSDMGKLDQASRLYRDGKPIVMIVSGSTDTVGSAAVNLQLSALRANTVVRELVARGIPIERFQVVAKGETEPAVPTQEGVAEPRNRRVEISWR